MTSDVQAAEKQAAEKLLTEEDLWPLIDQGRNVGLRKGKLVELGEKDVSPAGRKHGKIANRIAARITVFVDEHDLGSCFAAETGFIVERTPQTMLAPDFAFITKDRDTPQESGFGKVVPDFVAEVISPRDTLEDVEEKVRDWLTAGVKLVWTANMKTKSITAYQQRDGKIHASVFTEQDTIDGGEVFAGFTCAVALLFK